MELVVKAGKERVLRWLHKDGTFELVSTYTPIVGLTPSRYMHILFKPSENAVIVVERTQNGCKYWHDVDLDENTFKELYSIAVNVENLNDFMALRRKIEEVEDKLESEIRSLVNAVVDSLINIGVNTKVKEILRDRKMVLEILKDYAYYINHHGDC